MLESSTLMSVCVLCLCNSDRVRISYDSFFFADRWMTWWTFGRLGTEACLSSTSLLSFVLFPFVHWRGKISQTTDIQPPSTPFLLRIVSKTRGSFFSKKNFSHPPPLRTPTPTVHTHTLDFITDSPSRCVFTRSTSIPLHIHEFPSV